MKKENDKTSNIFHKDNCYLLVDNALFLYYYQEKSCIQVK